MKASIALSALILAVAAGVGWYNNQRFVAVRENQTKLVATAAKLGIVLDPSPSTDSKRATKHGRESGHENRNINAEATATDLIAMAKEIEVLKKQGDLTDAAAYGRVQEGLDRLMLLDSSQFKILIASIHTTTNLSDEARHDMIRSCLDRMTYEHPQTVLAIYTDCADLMGDKSDADSFAYHAVRSLATRDLTAASEWTRKNEKKFPDDCIADLEVGTLEKGAGSNPKLALKLMAEWNIQYRTRVIDSIAEASATPAARTANLAAIRDYLATLPDDKTRNEATMSAISGFTRSLETEGYATATQWIANEKFSPTELEKIAVGLHEFRKSDGAGAWIDWMGANLPTEASFSHIDKLVRKWTEDDYQAAGKWLTTTPASPTKNTAIRSYAETVSAYDPATATQWAMTLPPGRDRDATLKHIQEHSPAK
jgi:hypothetical protein